MDLEGEMERQQLFIFLNHEFDNGIELFNEIGVYKSDSNRDISAGSWRSGMFSIPSTYYWFSQLPESIGFPTNRSVGIDGWRPFNLKNYRIFQKQGQKVVHKNVS